MTALRELDLRAAKKQVCKITPELVAALKERFCKVRGGVIKKAKGGKKKAAKAWKKMIKILFSLLFFFLQDCVRPVPERVSYFIEPDMYDRLVVAFFLRIKLDFW